MIWFICYSVIIAVFHPETDSALHLQKWVFSEKLLIFPFWIIYHGRIETCQKMRFSIAHHSRVCLNADLSTHHLKDVVNNQVTSYPGDYNVFDFSQLCPNQSHLDTRTAAKSQCRLHYDWFGWLVGFLTSSSTTRLYRGRAPRQERLTILRAATHETELGDHDFCLIMKVRLVCLISLLGQS